MLRGEIEHRVQIGGRNRGVGLLKPLQHLPLPLISPLFGVLQELIDHLDDLLPLVLPDYLQIAPLLGT